MSEQPTDLQDDIQQDEIARQLEQMVEQGIDLEQEYEVEFSVIFPSQELALKFGHLLLEHGQKLSFCTYQGNDQLPWEITAYPRMLLSYDNIIAYQALLIEHSEHFQGQYDGWYCQALS
ncbi:ribonuclease E inhibitor RraB [Thalassotalea euphylliae]|uniref:ribonuclease E inhibitor RraB n=1 Tax=Thalassotalea euphylliae TaxID=1655234 RepID=UPI00363EB3E5